MAVKPKAGEPKKAPVQQRAGGRPRIEISSEKREAIKRLATVGTPQEVIARIVGFSVDTLDRHCRAELDAGLEEANAQIAGALFAKAMAGDTSSIIWWEKTRAGKHETTRTELTGKDGGAIKTEITVDDVLRALPKIDDEC
ncbi:hypothetical protein GCM10008023_05860 [Sphingomonas glacialis]|uniref:Uncharacterized protein n=1 Tax=Sphingomonas glacialis TaxID=658225 RepID=A0ABQ3LIK0_9SPHN|nr:hypothetical protein [Sphingomonas glacialis]GHH09323.1 hypothetical protein GCM10008023_05860 [Sphingomonas glacialis]